MKCDGNCFECKFDDCILSENDCPRLNTSTDVFILGEKEYKRKLSKSLYQRMYRQKNKEKMLDYYRQYYLEHKEKIKEYKRNYYLTHVEDYRKRDSKRKDELHKYYLENREKILQRQKERRKKNILLKAQSQ